MGQIWTGSIFLINFWKKNDKYLTMFWFLIQIISENPCQGVSVYMTRTLPCIMVFLFGTGWYVSCLQKERTKTHSSICFWTGMWGLCSLWLWHLGLLCSRSHLDTWTDGVSPMVCDIFLSFFPVGLGIISFFEALSSAQEHGECEGRALRQIQGVNNRWYLLDQC